MRKFILLMLVCVFSAGFLFAAGDREEEPLKIAYFISDLSNVFHQARFAAAKTYAMEEYGVEVFAFDGKSDSNVMTQNIDQLAAQGMDMATLQIWDPEGLWQSASAFAKPPGWPRGGRRSATYGTRENELTKKIREGSAGSRSSRNKEGKRDDA